MGEVDVWNLVAKVYADKFMSMDIYNSSYDKFYALLPTGSKLLELGCGPGVITKYLIEHRPDLQILGTYYASKMIELASQNVPSARFEVLDAKEIRILKQKFNGIVAGFILPYLTKKEVHSFLQNCAELLEKKGSFYLSFVKGKESDSHVQKGSTGDELFFHYFELDFIEQTLNSNGFEIIEKFEIDYQRNESKKEMHTALIAQKKG